MEWTPGHWDELRRPAQSLGKAPKPGLLGLVRAHQKLIQTTSDKFYLKGSAKSVKFLSFLKYNKELSLGSGQGS